MQDRRSWTPVHFLYLNFHDAIRSELEDVQNDVRSLERAPEKHVNAMLLGLRDRCRFLEQVHSYHSSVEDEVVYPALDAKVKNVTVAYSHEHRDEELLMEQFLKQINTALSCEGPRTDAIRMLVCKVEEIHTTLRKHLAKEEEQLLPLLVANFTHQEQAELIAQFLYSIPLATVERVLAWLRPAVPDDQQMQLLTLIRAVVPDSLLLQLLSGWLGPASLNDATSTGLGPPLADSRASQPHHPALESTMENFECCGNPSQCIYSKPYPCAGSVPAAAPDASISQCPSSPDPTRPPLNDIIHIHRSICSSLEVFLNEARALRGEGTEVSGSQLQLLVDRHRFLRSVCLFHTASEEDVMYPEVRRLGLTHNNVLDATLQCMHDHAEEVTLLEDLGRLLADVRAYVRRGRKEVSQMLERLCSIAARVCASMADHMRREELELFPLLERELCHTQQRALLWRTLRAMPLRLLEKVMPWIVAELSDSDTDELLNNIRLGAPQADVVLVKLLSQWAIRGRLQGMGGAARPPVPVTQPVRGIRGSLLVGGRGGTTPAAGGAPRAPLSGSGVKAAGESPETESAASSSASVLQGLRAGISESDQEGGHLHPSTCELRLLRQASDGGSGATLPSITAAFGGCRRRQPASPPLDSPPGYKRQKVPPSYREESDHGGNGGYTRELHAERATAALDDGGATISSSAAGGVAKSVSGTIVGGFNPIDHIFQFHNALKQELKELERDAFHLENVIREAYGTFESDLRKNGDDAAASTPPTDPCDGETNIPLIPPKGAGVAEQPFVAEGSEALLGAAANTMPSAQQAEVFSMPKACSAAVQQLSGRFQFLWGIYCAHSRSEDEIVFPALESKQALRNVSHAYTLDHQQEEQLFIDLDKVITQLKGLETSAEARALSMDVRRMCAAIRASLETHVRSEESELWPLFAEHFTVDEQQYLVGVIIGRTGAQVLQTLLPWISESFSDDEKEAMMESIRQVTRNTMFDQWLGAVKVQQVEPPSNTVEPSGVDLAQIQRGSGSGQPSAQEDVDREDLRPLTEVAEYLASTSAATTAAETGAGAVVCAHGHRHSHPHPQQQVTWQADAPAGTVGGVGIGDGDGAVPLPLDASGTFRPGWEDIFRMNQKQLEAAIHRVSNDASLEPGRKAYLIQNIMVSRYIVSQQKRIRDAGVAGVAGTAAGAHSADLGGSSGRGPGGSDGVEEASTRETGGPSNVSTEALASCRSYHGPPHEGVLGCQHYQRKCQLVAPCCNKPFTCRLCHDEASSHRMDRRLVREVMCMLCAQRGPVGQRCGGCGSALAAYYCDICHLFDDDPKHDIYHCPFCNICRRGRGLGVDFFHCMTCNACMSLSLFKAHVCRSKAMMADCPVCSECLFDSLQPVKELPCGHLMHSSCFATYIRYNYTCPLCTKSIGDMTVYFQMLDSLLASERLPAEYAGRTQMILCNDCGKSGFAPFHFVYHSCPHCRSYNTRVK